jgi:plasmid stabilization system protein ParE
MPGQGSGIGRQGDRIVSPGKGVNMPQSKWSAKRERQYEHIKSGLVDRADSEDEAEEIAARTVNKERARNGEAATASRGSVTDISSGRRGGLRSHRGQGGRTRQQLYDEARRRPTTDDLPPVEAVVAGALPASEGEPDQPEDEKDGRGDPQQMDGEPQTGEQQHDEKRDHDDHCLDDLLW